MDIPLDIRFHNMDPSAAMEAAIRERVQKLEKFGEHIVSCHVTVDAPHKHHHQGNLFQIKVDVRLPGGNAIASRDPAKDHAHEDAYVALRDAFKAVQRQVKDYVRVQRGKVKTHEVPPHGKIATLHADQDHGFIATPDGREIYFHRNSVLNADFDSLNVGHEVTFSEEPGDHGPQATTVHVTGKHHIVG